MFELHHLTAHEQWDWLQRGEITPEELATHYLARIERLDGDLGAFVTVTPERAVERARTLTDHVRRSAPLWGLPFADKDLTRRAGVTTKFGSRLMESFVPDASDELATVLDEAGAISLGKTNTPEFGMPSYTESLVAPPARTPWNTELGAGGSSGGAAVAVAAGLLPFAPGSDGGGSIRIPAAATGLVGLKPSRGLVPAASGIGSLAGLGVGGPIARTVADAAMLLDGMLGTGDFPFTLRAPRPDGPLLASAVRGEGRFNIGVMTTSPWDEAYEITISPEAHAALDVAVDHLNALGHGIEETALAPSPDYANHFRAVWKGGASAIPVDGDKESQRYPEDFYVKHVFKSAPWFFENWDAAFAERLIKEFRLPTDRRIKKLSRGQLSAVGIIVGLASRAPLTFFDEPYLGLDAVARQLFYDRLLEDFAEHPRTVVLSTHLIDEVSMLLEHVLVIDEGTIIIDSDAESLRASATTVVGTRASVDAFVTDRDVLHRDGIGGLASVTVGALNADDRAAAVAAGLELSPVSLQQLIIKKTGTTTREFEQSA